MFSFEYSKEKCHYWAFLSYNTSLATQIYLDTGSPATVISATHLFDISNQIELKKFENMIPNDVYKRNFLSASGNAIPGYLCNSKNVKINGKEINNFYFFLSFQLHPLSIVGNDFIHYTSAIKLMKNEFVINAFDIKQYENQFSGYKPFELDL